MIGLALVSALALLALGYLVFSKQNPSDFTGNVLAEGAGVLVGAVVGYLLAWYLIERHIQEQNERIARTVHARLAVVRAAAAGKVTEITTAAFDIPKLNSFDSGVEYVRDHYSELRHLLNYQAGKPKWYRGYDRDPSRVALMAQSLGDLSRLIAGMTMILLG